MFTAVLLKSTYKDGKPGRLTKAHEMAEHHRFKKNYLFKNLAISKECYALRLIQHFLIIDAIEGCLKNLTESDKTTLSPFFALSYLEHLWRSKAIQGDLQQLDVDPQHIEEKNIANKTKDYVVAIKQLAPKQLLAHFLLHIAGFMHGGKVIQTKYIGPSNRITSYQISTHQYDFETAASLLPRQPAFTLDVYKDMMSAIDAIPLSEPEMEVLLCECEKVYQHMTEIYDELCEKQAKPLKKWCYFLIPIGLGLIILGGALSRIGNNNSADAEDQSAMMPSI